MIDNGIIIVRNKDIMITRIEKNIEDKNHLIVIFIEIENENIEDKKINSNITGEEKEEIVGDNSKENKEIIIDDRKIHIERDQAKEGNNEMAIISKMMINRSIIKNFNIYIIPIAATNLHHSS